MKENSPIPRTQEVAVWWGGYSPWTMLPSLIVSVALTGVIVWWAWTTLARADVKLAVFSLAGVVWCVQTLRFGSRLFGANYHITTRRLVQEWGVLRKRMRTLFLSELRDVEVKRSALEELLGVGRLIFHSRDSNAMPMIWTGVRQCNQLADRVRAMLKHEARPGHS